MLQGIDTMRSTYFIWMLMTVAIAAGCSSSDVAEDEGHEAPESPALAATLPVVTDFGANESLADTADEVAPFEENLDIFTPPKMIIPIEIDEPEDDSNGELPPLRLVGFIGSAGDKALVSVDGERHIVTAGKRLNGVEIVSVASPKVALKWGETELTLDFYKPNKSDRPKVSPSPSMTFSPGLSNFGAPRNPSGTATPPRPTPPPRPAVSLPSLPGLPSPGNSIGDDLEDFPDLGVGPGPPPAP